MQLKSASNSSPKRRDFSPRGSRLKKKHKRLDAISETVYNQNRVESSKSKGESENADSELRRSSRVRRGPVVLDSSPPPVKKRKKVDKVVKYSGSRNGRGGVGSVKKEGRVEEEEETPGTWKSRLRSRERTGMRRRKLFDEVEREESHLSEKKGKLLVYRSKRRGRVKAVNRLGSEEKEDKKHGGDNVSGKVEVTEKGEDGEDEEEAVEGNGEDDLPVSGSEMAEVSDEEASENDAVRLGLDEEQEKHEVDGLGMENKDDANDNVEHVEHGAGKAEEMKSQEEVENDVCEGDKIERPEGGESEVELESRKDEENLAAEGGEEKLESESGNHGEDERNSVELDGLSKTGAENGGHNCEGEGGLMKVDENPLEGEKDTRVNKSKNDSIVTLGQPRIKQGRRCGLCGCGNDGKPPKRLVQSVDGSDNEAYSGSSASEEPNYFYDIWDGFGDESGWLGRLLGPINDRYGIAGIWVHQHCAVWSPEVYFAGLGCLKNVRAALCRGRALKCTRCGRPGATIGCRVDRCPKTYHLPCARASGCIFDHRKFLIACTDHRHLFQPYGSQYTKRIKKLKAKKMKLEIRKLSNDAWRKDVEAEEKWLENCGEDEEFLKRESKRLNRDLLRIAPVYIGGTDLESGKLFEGWESVAGLKDVIQCMKEVVILPLLYPEFFSNIGITPPRGVLLHGYPGTGKTLVVRALIGSCAHGDKRIAYFARKGADCLGKYVGDAERQLRLLFQVAERSQPSIIFFDEIDGLAPCRTRQQDQTHSSVVSTLLALMDGLKSRGSVVVIGATNRPEAVDPALRRPGRFDREIYFPLPSVEDRAAILALHTKRWPKSVAGSLLKWIASQTVGFAGADLQALCTQAAIIALKRNFPLQQVLSSAAEKSSAAKCPLPAFAVEERDWLEALACAPPPCSRREAGIAAYDLAPSPLPKHLIPYLLKPLSMLLLSLHLDESLSLPPSIRKAGILIKSVLISTMENKNLPVDQWLSHVDILLNEEDVAKKIEQNLSFGGIVVGETSCTVTDALFNDFDDDSVKFEPYVAKPTVLFKKMSFSSRRSSGFRVLIAGSPRSGQRHFASCILQCFVGNVEIQKIDMATVSQEGHGDMVQGITQILMKCSSLQSCMVYMPRIDLWAVETFQQITESDASPISDGSSENKDVYSAHGEVVVERQTESSVPQIDTDETAEQQCVTQSRMASLAWCSFVEQVESICVSTSLTIVATSECPYSEFPCMIKQFFKSDGLKSNQSNPLEHAVPWFLVHLDENFDREAVINQAVAKLLKDIIWPFVQLARQGAHNSTGESKEKKVNDVVRSSLDSECHNKDDVIAENGVSIQCPRDSSLEIPPMLNSRSLKGKSNLMLAIATFGYQILRYPHFAELCWFTSKLKEGPCADVNGPWKGWPFNSCIICPINSIDKGFAISNSHGIKTKERSGLVRGLVAVGLLAYRGTYKSVREVSSEIRKVLELLVEQVNEKVQAGKDRYQYLHLLSQVAYLEDMVNSWAYSLQSLDFDPLTKMSNSKLSVAEFPDNCMCLDSSVQGEERERETSFRNLRESKQGEGSPSGVASEYHRKGENGFCHANFEGEVAVSEEDSRPSLTVDGSLQKIGGQTNLDNADVHLDGSIRNELNKSPEEKNMNFESQLAFSTAKEPNRSFDEQSGNGDSHLADSSIKEQNGNVQMLDHTTNEQIRNYDQQNGNAVPQFADTIQNEHNRNFDEQHENGISHHGTIINEHIENVKLQLADGIANDQNGTASTECKPEKTENLAALGQSCDSLKKSNGFPFTEPVVFARSGLSGFSDPNGFSVPHQSCNVGNGSFATNARNDSVDAHPNRSEYVEDISFLSNTSSSSAGSGVMCSYRCCSGCLHALHFMIRKMLIRDLRLKDSHYTAEDVHDAVASLLVNLLSAVGKVDFSGRISCSVDFNRTHGDPEIQDMPKCYCKSSENCSIIPMECDCHHPLDEYLTAKVNSPDPAKVNNSTQSQFGLDPIFVFRDGVLVPVVSEEDASFHCKYEAFCLCSLIKLIEMVKQRFD